MYLDQDQTVLFVHIPKNAGSTIATALTKLQGPPHPAVHASTKHETLPAFARRRGTKSLRRWLGRHVDETKPFSFAVIRHPWERMVSFYAYLKKTKPKRPEVAAWNGFADFIRDLEQRNEWLCARYSMKSQASYISEGGAPLVHQVCSFANLAEDLEHCAEHTGLHLPPQRKNASEHGAYLDYYDDHARKVVAEYFQEDLDYFGYQFDSLEPRRNVGRCRDRQE